MKKFIGIALNSMKEEIMEVRLENQELMRSLEFTQGKLRDAESTMEELKEKCQNMCKYEEKTNILSECLRLVEDNSRKNNVVINGINTLKDENNEKLQHHVNKLLQDALGINVVAERGSAYTESDGKTAETPDQYSCNSLERVTRCCALSLHRS